MLADLASLIPDPLHPAIVHLPIALALLVPLFAIGALVAIRRQARPVAAWSVTVALLLALSLSAWAATETGEDQEDRVERVVGDAPLHTHEEAAETFLWLSVALLGVSSLGLLGGRVGASARLLATAGSLGLLVAGYRVGHSGGELVYTHGAAGAYVSTAAAGEAIGAAPRAPGPADADDDRH